MTRGVLSEEMQKIVFDVAHEGISGDGVSTYETASREGFGIKLTKDDSRIEFSYENPNLARTDGWNPPATQLWINEITERTHGYTAMKTVNVWSIEGFKPNGDLHVEHSSAADHGEVTTRISSNPSRTFRALARLSNIHMRQALLPRE